MSTAPSMNYRQLEEAINKWTQELEEQEAVFLDQATQVNAWDRLLIENGDMVATSCIFLMKPFAFYEAFQSALY